MLKTSCAHIWLDLCFNMGTFKNNSVIIFTYCLANTKKKLREFKVPIFNNTLIQPLKIPYIYELYFVHIQHPLPPSNFTWITHLLSILPLPLLLFISTCAQLVFIFTRVWVTKNLLASWFKEMGHFLQQSSIVNSSSTSVESG